MAKHRTNTPSSSAPLTLTAPVADTLTETQRKDAVDEAEMEQRIELDRALDKIGSIDEIEHTACAFDQSPSQCFGGQVIIDYGGTDTLPAYSFSRWYFGKKIIVDLFMTEEKYNAADVEGRRKMAQRYGFKYAALGPKHSRYPLKDAAQRKKYPSLVEQLAQKG